MIQHKIKEEKKRHEEEVVISKSNYLFVKRCLEVHSLEEMSDEELEAWGYKKNDCKLIFLTDFDDEATVIWKLCSGTTNYYDDVVLEYPNGKSYTMECTFDLDDVLIETPTDIYYVKLIIR